MWISWVWSHFIIASSFNQRIESGIVDLVKCGTILDDRAKGLPFGQKIPSF